MLRHGGPSSLGTRVTGRGGQTHVQLRNTAHHWTLRVEESLAESEPGETSGEFVDLLQFEIGKADADEAPI